MQTSSDALQSQSAQGQMEVRDSRNEPRFQHLEHIFSTITRGIDADINELNYRRGYHPRRCEDFCRCSCHRRRKRLREFRLMAFTKSLGAFTFSFWSPLGEACNLPSCTTERSKWVKATYTLPVWLFHTTISVLASYTAPPELLLRVYRRIPNNIDTLHNGTLYHFVARGDIDNVKRLLLRKDASITDVKAIGGESILHTAFNMRHKVKDFSMIRFLVQEGADWFQAKDNGHLPCKFTLRPHKFQASRETARCDRQRAPFM